MNTTTIEDVLRKHGIGVRHGAVRDAMTEWASIKTPCGGWVAVEELEDGLRYIEKVLGPLTVRQDSPEGIAFITVQKLLDATTK